MTSEQDSAVQSSLLENEEKQQQIDTMAQKVPLAVSTFAEGEKLIDTELENLGLDVDTEHMKIVFDNEKTVSYGMCSALVISLCTIVLWPFTIIFYFCIKHNCNKWAASRVAAVTGKQLVLQQGYYTCCCCCWNQATKSVPLEKITDLQLQQGCIQRCFDIHEIQVQTASNTSESGPEMRLIGLTEPMLTRSKILKVRDVASGSNIVPVGNSGPNPLLPAEPVSTKELQAVMSSQNDTMLEIKDVLQDMRTALVSMNEKMEKRE